MEVLPLAIVLVEVAGWGNATGEARVNNYSAFYRWYTHWCTLYILCTGTVESICSWWCADKLGSFDPDGIELHKNRCGECSIHSWSVPCRCSFEVFGGEPHLTCTCRSVLTWMVTAEFLVYGDGLQNIDGRRPGNDHTIDCKGLGLEIVLLTLLQISFANY